MFVLDYSLLKQLVLYKCTRILITTATSTKHSSLRRNIYVFSAALKAVMFSYTRAYSGIKLKGGQRESFRNLWSSFRKGSTKSSEPTLPYSEYYLPSSGRMCRLRLVLLTFGITPTNPSRRFIRNVQHNRNLFSNTYKSPSPKRNWLYPKVHVTVEKAIASSSISCCQTNYSLLAGIGNSGEMRCYNTYCRIGVRPSTLVRAKFNTYMLKRLFLLFCRL